MRLLLDTHALIWFAAGDQRLPLPARDAIADPRNAIFVSAASAWEISAKHRKGKLPEAGFLVTHWAEILREYGIVDLPVTSLHAFRAGLLAFGNADPFDRMIVAQAQLENLVAASNETAWDGLGIVRLWDTAA
ncbi:type II toxin-antitoxin system VapC family toxin [Methylobacterium soli]|uniref:Type II toxin-antitoxin system VapC family toxin n=1 Tax=Methylobacterium soli TaxID=553447 RepID=A0A6L3SRT8_9HYPH|nr:type II toxin-antitoxin system VapC family toxin [Methylobacterium soli]KAB1075852.1 type II toxin-antitoxin system VapC family toxin [Methylobacterium soli]